ncbi:hypothetical protein BKA70DRAFT_1128403 [Coprinopsis sp. MPI-PUGE-AT-0042]|nr:hypothetical protein BKA70DRAFT_1128403 [Coprinopsis sp. MPI-PUGE-AT-0042]
MPPSSPTPSPEPPSAPAHFRFDPPAPHPLLTSPSSLAYRAEASKVQAEVRRAADGSSSHESATVDQQAYWTRLVLEDVQLNAEDYISWIGVPSEEADQAIIAALEALFLSQPATPPPTSRGNYLSWLIKKIRDRHDGGPLVAAADARQQKRNRSRRHKKKAGRRLAVFQTDAEYQSFHRDTLYVAVKRRSRGKEYPRPERWVAEDDKTFNTCKPYYKSQVPLDRRRHRKRKGKQPGIQKLKSHRLSYTAPTDRNVVLYDADSGEIFASVVRNFANSPSTLEWVKGVVDEGLRTRKSVRLEDTGKLVQIGVTAGGRSHPEFGMARNLLRKVDRQPDKQAEDNQKNASVGAYFWRRVQLMHPPEVSQDIEGFYRKHDFPKLDPDWPSKQRTTGPVELHPSCEAITFHEAQFSPSCLVFSERYSRQVSRIQASGLYLLAHLPVPRPVHQENQPHEWAVSWTTHRSGTDPRGNHFYIADYGVRIPVAEDTSIAWKPTHFHTSSLGSWDPQKAYAQAEDPVMNQQGIAIVTSNRVPGVYQKWKEAKGISGEERFDGAVADMHAISEEIVFE